LHRFLCPYKVGPQHPEDHGADHPQGPGNGEPGYEAEDQQHNECEQRARRIDHKVKQRMHRADSAKLW
jgi:hypothetical protein